MQWRGGRLGGVDPELERLLVGAREASEAGQFRAWLDANVSFECADCKADVSLADMAVELTPSGDAALARFYCPACAPAHPGASSED